MSNNKEPLPIAWRWRWKAYVTSIGPSHPKYGWQYEDGAEKPSVHPDNVQHIDFQPLYAAQPVVLSDALRDKVRDAIAAALGEAMDCTRVWSAWSYGTMGPDDFSVVVNDDDRLEEIVDAALNTILAAKEQA